MSRSEFFQRAARLYLDKASAKAVVDNLNQVYDEEEAPGETAFHRAALSHFRELMDTKSNGGEGACHVGVRASLQPTGYVRVRADAEEIRHLAVGMAGCRKSESVPDFPNLRAMDENPPGAEPIMIFTATYVGYARWLRQ